MNFLVTQDRCKVLKKIGYSTTLLTSLAKFFTGHLPTEDSMTKHFFSFLHTIPITDQELASISLEWNGQDAPLLIKQWLTGARTSEECFSLAFNHHQKNCPHDSFLKKVISITFQPQEIKTILAWDHTIQSLLEKLQNSNTQIGIVDNFSADAYTAMKNTFPEKYRLINGPIILSSMEKQLKGIATYTKILRSYSKNASVAFIDISKNYALQKAAQITSSQPITIMHNGNYRLLESELKKHEFIKD